MFRLGLLATALAIAASGCGSANSSDVPATSTDPTPTAPVAEVAGSCISMVVWNGTRYTGGVGELYAPVRFGEPLGTGFVPACNDTNLSDEEDVPVTIVPIADVSPQVAVGALGTESPYFAPGYLVQSPAHPLHDAVYRRDPDETQGFRCDEPRAIGGRVDFTPGFGTVIRVRGLGEASASLLRPHDNLVFVDAATEYSGLNRDGIPFLEEGIELSLVVSPCEGGGGARKLVVASMTPAS